MAKWDSTILKGDYVHMRCVAHILNLIVVDGLKDITRSVRNVREAVRYVRQSPARIKKFKEYVEMETIEFKNSLCLDVCTRWNSTYKMLNVAQKFERVFERFDEEDPYFKTDLAYTELVDEIDDDRKAVTVKKFFDGMPNSDDWSKCRKYATLLEHFYNLIVKVSGSLYVTSNSFFHEIAKVYRLLKKWQTSNNDGIRVMGDKMKKRFDKYWENPEKMNKMFFIAVILDPRYKLVFVEFLLKEVYREELRSRIMLQVKNVLYATYMEYKGKVPSKIDDSDERPLVQSTNHVDEASIEQEVWEEIMFRFQQNQSQSANLGDDNSAELEKYYREGREIDNGSFLILDWWKQNSQSSRFPVISLISHDVLAISISTVASESAFSTMGWVLDCFRNSLLPKMVESLICTQD